ncbi:MAG: F0F1 ATP synthase subunit epsilon, partial [Parvularculaceae bacterium]
GGFADVTPSGLTVLAEFAVPAEELTGDTLGAQKDSAKAELDAADNPEGTFLAQRAVDSLARL